MATDDSGVELDEVRVARLPEGKDPDEVIRESVDTWRTAVAHAQPIVDYLIDQAAEERDLRTAAGKDRFVRAVLPIVDVLPPVMRATYEDRIRRMSGVEEWLLHEARRAMRAPAGGSSGGSRITADAVLHSEEALPVREILRSITPTEAELLRLLLFVPDQQVRVTDQLGSELLPSTVARELYRAIVLMRAPDERGIPVPGTATPCSPVSTTRRGPSHLPSMPDRAPTRRTSPARASSTRWRTCCLTWRPTELKSAISTTSRSRPTLSAAAKRISWNAC